MSNKVDLYEPTNTGFICHSRTGNQYQLVYMPALTCNCPGYTYRGSCRHIDNAPQPQETVIEQYTNLSRPQARPINEQWINNMAYQLTHVTTCQ